MLDHKLEETHLPGTIDVAQILSRGPGGLYVPGHKSASTGFLAEAAAPVLQSIFPRRKVQVVAETKLVSGDH